ncbi:MAG: hypothetical protein ACRC57_03100 [Sarcina sp.]
MNKQQKNKKVQATNNKRKITNKKKKMKFKPLKFLRNIIILILIVFGIIYIIKPSTSKTTAQNTTSKSTTAPTNTTSSTVAQKQVVTPNATTEYYNTQNTLLNSIFRFNQNLYNLRSSNIISNIYPDSQNGVNQLNVNLSKYSSKLNPSIVKNDSAFILQLTQKNNQFITSVIAYNNESLSKNPNQEKLQKLQTQVLNNYNDVNTFMNSNLTLFKA